MLQKKKQVYQVILDINNEIRYPASGALEFKDKATGLVSSAIHKIDEPLALKLSTLFKSAAIKNNVSLTYLLACAALESRFDPLAFNRNLSGSNKENNPLKYDEGIAQMNIRYLIDAKDSRRDTAEKAIEFARTPELVIPYMGENKAMLLFTARNAKFSPEADPRHTNLLWVASTFYNMGRTGGLRAINNRTVNEHAARVAKLEVRISDELGVEPVMKDVL